MLRKISCYMVVLTLSLSLYSCFDIVEEVNMQANGSGKIKATLNLSKSKTKVASIMLMDSINGVKIPSKSTIQKEVSEIERVLNQTKGIRNVQSKLDFTNFIATLECEFDNVAALNAFTKALSSKTKVNLSGYNSYSYDKINKVLVRSSNTKDAKKEFSKLNAENKKVFKDAYYTSVYRFANNVSSSSNPKSSISANKKAVMLKLGAIDLINGNSNLSTIISLK